MKTKIKLIIIIGTILILALIVWIFYRANNINYQLNKLANGTPNQRARAADFLTEKRIYKAIPLMIKNVDNVDVSDINGKAPDYVGCYMTFNLEVLTKENFGYLCLGVMKKNTIEWQVVVEKWQDWYKNEYPAWLEAQNNK